MPNSRSLNLDESAMPKLLLITQFFAPDDVVASRQYTDLAHEQRRRGWDVTVLSSNRCRHNPSLRLPARESIDGIDVVRVHRPAWNQSKPISRLVTSAYLIAAWFIRSFG